MKPKIKIRVFILIFLLILAAALCIVPVLHNILNSGTGYTAYIYQDGELLKTISLSEISDVVYDKIEYNNGAYNIIQYKPGTLRIIEANCPDQTCVNQGYIYNSLVPITCLPHHLVIELKANDAIGNDSASDAITH